MTASNDLRDSIRVNLPLEDALKIGKLLGAQYDAVAICRDGHRSSQMIEQALISGIISTGGDVYLASECPAPLMPNMRTGCDCYVCVAADEPEKISGINLHNPDGSYLDNSQMLSLLSKEARILYPKYSGIGVTHKIYGIRGRYADALDSIIKEIGVQVILDGTFSSPTSVASQYLLEKGADVIIVNRAGIVSPRSFEEISYGDIIHTMDAYPGSIGAALNNDGSKVVIFDEKNRRVSHHALAKLMIHIFEAERIVAPIDVSLCLSDAYNKGVIVKTERNIKHVVDKMKFNEAHLGMDSHGRFVFPELSYTPDGIAVLMKVAEFATKERLCDFIDRIGECYREEKRVPFQASEEQFFTALKVEISTMDCTIVSVPGSVRLDFDNGYILFTYVSSEQAVDITCEAKDHLYAVILMDMGSSIVNSVIREIDW